MGKELSEKEIREFVFESFGSNPEFQQRIKEMFNFYYPPLREQYEKEPTFTVDDVALNSFLYGIVAGNAYLTIVDEPENEDTD
ncbi:MAG: hypothetical protein LUE89_00370 [Clostridiales bacterium]|nr:hypothetical protein [Clostridiales bacterium]